MTFPLSRKALAITCVIVALAGVAIAVTRPKSIESAVLGSKWVHPDRFRDHDLRIAGPAAGRTQSFWALTGIYQRLLDQPSSRMFVAL
jgi:hypothetical protein